MTNREAISALKNGQKLRREHWGSGSYIEKTEDGTVTYPDKTPIEVVTFEAVQWVGYQAAEEKPRVQTWLKV